MTQPPKEAVARTAARGEKQAAERAHTIKVRRWILKRLANDAQLVEDLGGGPEARQKRHNAWNAFEIEVRAAGFQLHEIVGALQSIGRLHP